MSKIEMLRLLINQRLTAAAEEIFGVFGRTIAEYEEEISRSKLEIDRQRRLLELSRKPQISLQADSSGEETVHQTLEFLSENKCRSIFGFMFAKTKYVLLETTMISSYDVLDYVTTLTSAINLNEEEPPTRIKEEEQEQDVWTDPPGEMPERSEQNNVGFVLFQSSAAGTQQDNSSTGSPVSKFQSQDLEDSGMDPRPGTSVQQTCSELNEDRPGACEAASGNGQNDSVDVAFPKVVDSYICSVCGKAFYERGQWAKHTRIHRKVDSKVDKSFTCDICGKRLTRSDGYQKHLRVHTGEKPYSCHVCGRSFSDNSNYKRHIRRHMREKSQQNSG
ncbi:hypothetical protein XENOCAPTIV_019141 [Xenoophorus captivus]|uniref:C2H2-type domain-containing protein n=1 Tax=Xenoophorus captivus TaxID=1517983 RepID=A0ABV0S7R2_9TELE